MANPDFTRIWGSTGTNEAITGIAYNDGWATVAAGNPPKISQFNSLDGEQDTKLAYLDKRSRLAWNTSIDYLANELATGADGKLYKALVNNTAKEPSISAADWTLFEYQLVSQAEAEAGVATTIRLWTALRVRQAIEAVFNQSGRVIQTKTVRDGAFQTGTTILPFDDTIPQNTDGNNFLSISITPKSTSSKIIVEAIINLGFNGSTDLSGALFLSGQLNALDAKSTFVGTGSTQVVSLALSAEYANTTLVAKTFDLHGGGSNAGTCYFNGSDGVRKFGGVYYSSIKVTEVKS